MWWDAALLCARGLPDRLDGLPLLSPPASQCTARRAMGNVVAPATGSPSS